MASTEGADRAEALLSRVFASDAPGAVVVIEQRGVLVLRRSYGLADLENGVAMSPEAVFRLGSLTKQFTAVAVLRLVEMGKLSLDAAVAEILPGCPQGLTARHLLNHTSGLVDWIRTSRSPALQHWELPHAALVALTQERQLEFEPGSDWRYCSFGFVLAGALIEKLSGLSYAEFVDTHILRVLGFKQTRFGEDNSSVPGYIRQAERIERVSAPPVIARSSNGLYGCADELVRWCGALRSNAPVGRAQLLQALSPVRLANGRSNNYGLGWAIRDYQGQSAFAHGGGIAGHSTYLFWLPDEQLCICIMANSQPPPRELDLLAVQVAGRVLGRPLLNRRALCLLPELLDHCVGTYRTRQGETRIFTRTDDQLWMERVGGRKMRVLAAAPREFFVDYGLLRLRFGLAGATAAETVSIDFPYGPEVIAYRC